MKSIMNYTNKEYIKLTLKIRLPQSKLSKWSINFSVNFTDDLF